MGAGELSQIPASLINRELWPLSLGIGMHPISGLCAAEAVAERTAVDPRAHRAVYRLAWKAEPGAG